MDNIASLLELSQLFIKDTSLKKEIQLAKKEPEKYLKKFSGRSKEHSLKNLFSLLPWYALIDGLYRRGLVRELDWKDNQEVLIFNGLELLKHHSDYTKMTAELSKTIPFIDEDIEEFLPQLNRKLLSYNVQLIWFDTNSDSYPISFLYSKNLKKAEELASQVKYGILHY